MSEHPVGTLRVVRILARLSLRRWANRMAMMRAKRTGKGKRGATPRKGGRSSMVLVFFGAMMLLNSFNISAQLLRSFSDSVRQNAPAHLQVKNESPTDPNGPIGLGGGRVRPARAGTWSNALWPPREYRPPMLALLGAVMLLLFVALVCTGVGSGNQELSQVGWSLEWLFTFPVPTRGLFLARLGEYTLTNAFAWFTAFPLVATLLFVAGLGWAALPFALLAGLAFNLLVASARLLLETWLRKRYTLHRLKNLQAGFTVLGLVFLFATFFLAMGRSLPTEIVDAAWLTPSLALANPISAPLLLSVTPLALLPTLTFAAIGALLSIHFCSRLVRDGLVSAGSGPYLGTRGTKASREQGPSRLRGLLGKEIRLLLRDRNFMLQTLFTPLLIIGFQFFANPSMGLSGMGLQRAATTAFGVGVYVLMFGGISVLAVERQALWLLWTFPRPLHLLLRQKVFLWAGVALLYSTAVLLAVFRPPDAWAALQTSLSVLGGVFIFAWIASALGILGTDPFEETQQRRVRQEYIWIYMLLASIGGMAIYTEAAWPKMVTGTLLGLIAFALWQRVGARLPLLLDPTEDPPRRVDLAYGLFVVLFFFQVQQIAAMAMFAFGAEALGRKILIAYSLAGGVIFFATYLHIVAKLKVARPLIALGIRGPSGAGRHMPLGLLAGLGAGGIGVAYLIVGQGVEPFRTLLREGLQMQHSFSGEDRLLVTLLAVVAAPIFEEFIFRALVYRGLRQTMSVRTSVLLSALVFAIVHPAASFVPVFCLGAIAAMAFERTGWLVVPMLTHAVYNAIVVLAGPQLLQ